MRSEHNQIRSVLEQLSACLDKKEYDTVPVIGETLLILIQQHNLKEENMLYPMSDQHLGHQQQFLIEKMQSI